MSYSLKDFLQTFVAEHVLTSGSELVLDVSPEEMQALGDFFVRGLCGWMLGLEAGRTRLLTAIAACSLFAKFKVALRS